MGKLDGRVAIVTGSSQGIGRGTAIAFAKEGANVVVVGRNVERIKKVEEECQAFGAKTLGISCDITKLAELEDLVKKVKDEFGRIDILVNNAIDTKQVVSIMDTTEEDYHKTMETGPHATWNLMRLVQPIMMEQKKGAIINLSSAAAIMSMADYGAYATAKAGIHILSQVAAKEWAPYIRVNTVAPMAYSQLFERQGEEWIKEFTKLLPLGYLGDPVEDIGPVMVFLASDDSKYVTGQNINVNGGIDIHL